MNEQGRQRISDAAKRRWAKPEFRSKMAAVVAKVKLPADVPTAIDRSGYPHLPDGRFVHVAVAERALGRPLPQHARVHHVNENKGDYSNTNLVICQDDAYHHLLHYRTHAFDATGDPTAVKCGYCHEWSPLADPDIEDWSDDRNKHRFWHRRCQRENARRNSALRAARARELDPRRIKTCPVCDVTFRGFPKAQLYCGPDCAKRGKANLQRERRIARLEEAA